MWLLDHNIPHKLREVLDKLGIKSETAYYRKWDSLENGDLVKVAVESGFTAILSRDRLFQKSAKKTLSKFPMLALVLINIDQNDAETYCRNFEEAWKRNPIKPIPGKLIEWP